MRKTVLTQMTIVVIAVLVGLTILMSVIAVYAA